MCASFLSFFFLFLLGGGGRGGQRVPVARHFTIQHHFILNTVLKKVAVYEKISVVLAGLCGHPNVGIVVIFKNSMSCIRWYCIYNLQ